MNTLILEGKWLSALVFAQLIKTVICTLISFILYCVDDTFDPYEITRPSYNERMDALPTENSYVNFTNEEVDADTEQQSLLRAKRFNTEGISELSTEPDYFKFVESPTKRDGGNLRSTFTRPTAHF